MFKRKAKLLLTTGRQYSTSEIIFNTYENIFNVLAMCYELRVGDERLDVRLEVLRPIKQYFNASARDVKNARTARKHSILRIRTTS